MVKVSSPLIQVKVIVNGRPIQEYHKDNKVFVEGRRGSNFDIEVTNLTYRRLLVHPTVDGLSAMHGQEASSKDSSQGYVLNPCEVMSIPGWRLNDHQVAQFFFAGSGQSYAEKKGKGRDRGVIACAVWEETPVLNYTIYTPPYTVSHPPYYTVWTFGRPITAGGAYITGQYLNIETISAANFAGSASTESSATYCCNCNETPTSAPVAYGNAQNLGAGFGEKTAHGVCSTAFNPASVDPAAVVVIYYDDIEGLRRHGIRISERDRDTGLPNPFPKDSGCTPPPDWRG